MAAVGDSLKERAGGGSAGFLEGLILYCFIYFNVFMLFVFYLMFLVVIYICILIVFTCYFIVASARGSFVPFDRFCIRFQ